MAKKENTFEEICRDIVAKKFQPVYILMGEEPFFMDRITDLLIENVLEFIKSNSQKGTSVACSLYANKGKENFYGKFGFEKLPNEKYGYGMIIEL